MNNIQILQKNNIYQDFNWEIYKELNPYLYIIGLRTEKDYFKNYLLEGRYIGRIYKEIQSKNSYHVLLTTIGKKTIFNMLKMLKNQLFENDFLTIIFDGKNNSKNYELVKTYCNDFKCCIIIIIEDENLGYWGHAIRNKHKNLKGDFVFHIDDDDIILDDTFDIIRKYCKDTNIIYIFKIILENESIIWKTPEIKYANISTQSGIIPILINKEGNWGLRYGGDFDFYNELSKKFNFIYINKIIYRKIGEKNKNKKIIYPIYN
jgi:hypothetical protein